MSFKPGQEVRLKWASPMHGTITNVIAEPGGNDSVVVQLDPIRCHASDLELIPASATPEELLATEARRGAVIKAWEADPSDPNRIQDLQVVMRELGWLRVSPA